MADEPKMSEPEPMAPMQATVISSGTGDGSIVKQVIQTPAGQPNIIIRVISPLFALSIRFGETFLTALLAGTGLDTLSSWSQVVDLKVSASTIVYLALSTAVLGLGKDLIVILGKLKQKYPLLDV